MYRFKLWVYIIIICLCYMFYGNTIKHEYALDDAIVITQNKFTKAGFEGINDIIKNDAFTGFFGIEKKLVSGGRYRPLSIVTFAIEYEFFGENSSVSHFINILLYALVCIALYNFLYSLFSSKNNSSWYFNIPFIATVLFLIHPVHTEVVANIKGRDEILTLLGGLLAANCTFKYLKSNHVKYLIFSFIWMVVGLFSKENAITFIVIIPLSIYFFTTTKIQKYILSVIPLIAATVIFLIIRKAIIGDASYNSNELMNNPFLHAEAGQKSATVIYTLGLYIKLLFYPHPLTYDYYPYHIGLVSWNNIWVLLSLAFYIGLCLVAIYGVLKKRIVSFGILFYFITLSLVSNILFPVGTFMNERFLFIPSIGFCIVLGWLFVDKFLKLNKRNGYIYSICIIGILIILSFTISHNRNKAWKNDYTLFSTDVKTSTNSAKSNTSYGGVLIDRSNELNDTTQKKITIQTAIHHLRKAISIHPTYFDPHLLLGNAYAHYDNIDSSIYFYKKSLKLAPKKDLLFKNIIIVLERSDNVDYKIKHYSDIYNINPNRYDICYKLGHLYGRYKNNIDESIKYLERAVFFKKDDFFINKDLGVAYGIKGDFKKSEHYLLKAIEINPEDIPTYKNLIATYMNLNQIDKAREVLRMIEEKE